MTRFYNIIYDDFRTEHRLYKTAFVFDEKKNRLCQKLPNLLLNKISIYHL